MRYVERTAEELPRQLAWELGAALKQELREPGYGLVPKPGGGYGAKIL